MFSRSCTRQRPTPALFLSDQITSFFIQIKFTKDILKGLAYIHKSGFVHRDIKAANILVEKMPTVLSCSLLHCTVLFCTTLYTSERCGYDVIVCHEKLPPFMPLL
jgi:serine/threonine protein kinase